MDQNSKIYIAGHSGLLGNALVKVLSSRGYTNLITVSRKELDLTDGICTDNFIAQNKPEYIFLAAGKTGGIQANKTYPVDFLHKNIAIQDNVFQACISNNVKALVFYASSCVYPKFAEQPIKEEYLWKGPVEETSEAYSAAKIAGLVGCKVYNAQHKKTKFICLLPNSMFGPHDNFDLEQSHVLSALIRKIHDAKTQNQESLELWGSGSPKREFIFSEDIADASLFAMLNLDKFENSHYNLGTGIDYSIKELAEMIQTIVGYQGKILWDTSKPDGTPKKLLDSTRFLKLGWKIEPEIYKKIEITYKWFLTTI